MFDPKASYPIAQPRKTVTIGFLVGCWAFSVLLSAIGLYRFGWGAYETRHALATLISLCFIPFSIFLTINLMRGRGIAYIDDGALIVYTDSYYSMPVSAVRTVTVDDEGKSFVIGSAETHQRIPGFLIEGGPNAAVERWTAFKQASNMLR